MVQYARFSFLTWFLGSIPPPSTFIYFDITRRAIVLVDRITVNAVLYFFVIFIINIKNNIIMTELTKNNLIWFGKVLSFALPVFIAIITFMGILNGITYGLDSFYGYVAALNIGVEGYFFYKLFKKLFKK